jgi:hypothetical protein
MARGYVCILWDDTSMARRRQADSEHSQKGERSDRRSIDDRRGKEEYKVRESGVLGGEAKVTVLHSRHRTTAIVQFCSEHRFKVAVAGCGSLIMIIPPIAHALGG